MNALPPVVLWAVALAAAPSMPPHKTGAVIAVVAPPGPDPAVAEALSRFRGEAASVGFEVTIVAGSAAATPLAQMESAARAASALATVAFVNGGDPRALDVWFTDRLTGKTVFGHVSVDKEAGDRPSVVLAVKAVDFLRARMFDILVARPTSLADASTASSIAVGPAPAPSRGPAPVSRFGLSIGVGALRSVQGLGTTFLPLLRAAYVVTAWSSLRITLGGAGTSSHVGELGGAGAVTEDVALGEWVLTPGRGRVRPALAVGMGVHDVRAHGMADVLYTARAASRASLAAALSVGLCVILTRRLVLGAEVGSFLLFPEPEIVVAGLDAGRTGRPGLSAALALEARF